MKSADQRDTEPQEMGESILATPAPLTRQERMDRIARELERERIAAGLVSALMRGGKGSNTLTNWIVEVYVDDLADVLRAYAAKQPTKPGAALNARAFFDEAAHRYAANIDDAAIDFRIAERGE